MIIEQIKQRVKSTDFYFDYIEGNLTEWSRAKAYYNETIMQLAALNAEDRTDIINSLVPRSQKLQVIADINKAGQ